MPPASEFLIEDAFPAHLGARFALIMGKGIQFLEYDRSDTDVADATSIRSIED
jgi:hypothetical protein